MQKWKVFEDRWHPVKDDEGRHYLVSEVEAALAEKDREHAKDITVLIKQLQIAGKQITTLKANAEFLSSELERLRSRVVLTPAESHLTLQAALKEGGKP